MLELIREEVAGDPTTGRRWIRHSLEKLRTELGKKGFRVGRNVIRRLLRKQDIAPKSNVKHLAPKEHPERDRQFQYLQQQRRRFEAEQLPIVSVDTKKKELIGPFRNPGRLWSQQAPEVYTYDFPSDALGKVLPFGIYDVTRNEGYVYLGTSANTADFAVEAIVRWWRDYGRGHYPCASELLILADAGGSNGCRPRRWKWQLQRRLADPYRLTVTVCPYPPGASKWNPVEHRLFSQISQTWAGTPLTSVELVLKLLRATQTKTGLKVHASLVRRPFSVQLKVSDEEMVSLRLERHPVCPLWNYTIRPR